MFELQSIQVIGAIAALIIGLWMAGYITHLAQKAFNRSKLNKDVQPFLLSLINAVPIWRFRNHAFRVAGSVRLW